MLIANTAVAMAMSSISSFLTIEAQVGFGSLCRVYSEKELGSPGLLIVQCTVFEKILRPYHSMYMISYSEPLKNYFDVASYYKEFYKFQIDRVFTLWFLSMPLCSGLFATRYILHKTIGTD